MWISLKLTFHSHLAAVDVGLYKFTLYFIIIITESDDIEKELSNPEELIIDRNEQNWESKM